MNSSDNIELTEDQRDCFQEITNVAMGQAANVLARMLDVFIVLPVPNVNILEASELTMALTSVDNDDSVSAICQGFTGGGIAGEAMLIFNDASFEDIAKLAYEHMALDDDLELEMIMDAGNILIGACLKGIADQLDLQFSQGQPVVLGRHCHVPELIHSNKNRWTQTLTIEVNYQIENHKINCDLLLLFTEDSLPILIQKANYLLE